jgi:hypothetical protein
MSHNYSLGYSLCSDEMKYFLTMVFVLKLQGKNRSKNCTGMYSFSFYPEKLTFVAHDDCVIPSETFQC